MWTYNLTNHLMLELESIIAMAINLYFIKHIIFHIIFLAYVYIYM